MGGAAIWTMRRILAIASCLLLLVACSEQGSNSRQASIIFQPEIAWYSGSLGEALEAARELNLPLLIFSRGHWCPPCQQLDTAVFNQPDVIARTEGFVAIRVFAAAPDVQPWRKTIGISSRPTSILLRPDGSEIARLPGALGAEQYARLLDIAISAPLSVYEIIEAMAKTGHVPTKDEWWLLAYHTWPRVGGPLAEGATLRLADLAERCPAELRRECSRLHFANLHSALAAKARGSGPPASEDQFKLAVHRVNSILATPSLVRDNLCEVLMDGDAIVRIPALADSAEGQQLILSWSAALRNLLTDNRLPLAERLAAGASLLEINRSGSLGGLHVADLVQRARQAVASAPAIADAEERQFVVYQAARLLSLAGEAREATMLLRKELERTLSPYDFITGIADLAHRMDRVGQTLAWLRDWRDWADTASDRFLRGTYYLVALTDLQPGNPTEIESAGLFLLKEIIRDRRILDGETEDRLETVNDRLLEWSSAHDGRETLRRLWRRMQPVCDRFPLVGSARISCQRFLIGA